MKCEESFNEIILSMCVYASKSCVPIINDEWKKKNCYIFFSQKLNQSSSKEGTPSEYQFIFQFIRVNVGGATS